MDAKQKGIMGALADPDVEYYTIPEFQRPFTWQESQIEQLWDDLYENYTDYSLNSTSDSNSNSENYFLGPLVFVRNKQRNSYDIIDGQQRTTTLHVLFWTMYHKLIEPDERKRMELILLAVNGTAKLRVANEDISTMLALQKNIADISGNSKMVECVKILRKKVASLSNNALTPFWQFIRDSIVFVVIVADDYSSAWELFIGLNGKGEPLNPSDLIKAHVCGNSDVGEDASKIWQSHILPLHAESTFCLLMITRYRLIKFLTENALFKEFSKNFPSNIGTIDLTTLSFTFSRFWLSPIDSLKDELSLGTAAYRHLRMIRELGRRDHTPLLFKFAESFGVDAIFEESFLKPIAAFQLRMAVVRKRSRERKIMTDLNKLDFKDKGSAIASISEFVKKEAPNDEDFETYVSKLDYGAAPTRAILLDYEEGERGNRQIRDFQLEHLMPETPTDFWFTASGTKDRNEYKSVSNNIGNLFPIDALTNPSVGNEDFDTKKSAYQKHLVDWSIARFTRERTSWTAFDIKKRAEVIANWAQQKWSF